MKNSSSVIGSKNQLLDFVKKSSLLLLTIMLFQFNSLEASNGECNFVEIENSDAITIVDPYFSDIISKIKMGHFFNATVSTLNQKTRNKEVDVYSSYGFTQDVTKLNDTSLELKNLSTSFSDRSHFSGTKTVEKIIITDNGSKVNVEVIFVTWSNTSATLTNVVLKKINKVTFLTGYVVNGNNATYYTIALKDMGALK